MVNKGTDELRDNHDVAHLDTQWFCCEHLKSKQTEHSVLVACILHLEMPTSSP